MNIGHFISRLRESILDDAIEPYLWSNSELIDDTNDMLDELYQESLLTKDQTTTATCNIKLLSNLGIYDFDDRILHVRSARLQDDATFGGLERTTEDRLDATITDWRSETGTPTKYAPNASSGHLSIYPKFDDTGEYTGDSDITFVSATKTISQVGADFSDLEEDDEICITGTDDNDGYFTIATEGTTSFVVSETLVNESNTSAIIRKVRDTLLMTVNRLPLTPFTTADIALETDITDIPDNYQRGLMHGVGWLAFLKPDSQTFDKGMAEYHRVLWEKFKTKTKISIAIKNKPDKTRVPRSGTSIYY